VGVGNIYANEALWRAGIDPSREARSLSAYEASQLRSEIVQILEEAIEARGTSFRDYRDASGESGSFVNLLAGYGREGEPRRRCGRRLVGTHAIDGRATVLRVSCQQCTRLPRCLPYNSQVQRRKHWLPAHLLRTQRR